MKDKELEKIEKYRLLKDEFAKVWHTWKVIVVPVVIGALGATVREANRCEREVGSYPEDSIVGDSKNTKESTVPVLRRRKRETWDPW